MRLPRSRLFFLTLASVALAVVLLANAHLVFVATNSQPKCVPHVKINDTTPPAASSATPFSAANPSC